MDDTLILFPDPSLKDAKKKRAQSLVGTSKGRDPSGEDFYPTPPSAVEALLRVEQFEGLIYEPCCGDGAICKVLEAHGHVVMATDLVQRGWGEETPLNFLQCQRRVPNIITNPPYSLAQQFIEKSLELTSNKVAMLCKLAILEGAKRKVMFERAPLARVHVFSKRLSMFRNGIVGKNSGMMPFCWLVFDHSHSGSPTISWL